ncbi:NAD-dependent epimerase/dehydratase family protein [Catelliglobosispora koreensis]|uniref:NAD-dependent epimerase/dehydratase family protein n=1 Tax=Catelliglobosispora koreensis TaxID=129052 RepID=UPI00047617C7|nr:NAD-dependent epimerase/dehydratase family protein [Catelliglobosispora koreensis]
MRILIVGGTRFVGRHITAAAVAAGHDVTLLHRRPSDLFPTSEHLLTDRNEDLSALHGRQFDATVDVSAYYPRQVKALAQALGDGAGQYVFISSVSAYGQPDGPGYSEQSRLHEPIDPEPEKVTNDNYGPLKVMCEQAAVEAFGPSTLIIRPTYVIGPLDYTGRFTYWVHRIAAGGEVLAPGKPEWGLQVIDGRDLGDWTVRMVERAAPGAFHTVHPAPPFGFKDMLDTIAATVAPAGTTITWVDPEFVTEQELGALLPLWPEGELESVLSAADPSAALGAGLVPRSLAESIKDTLDHEPVPTTFLSPEREAEALKAWHERS